MNFFFLLVDFVSVYFVNRTEIIQKKKNRRKKEIDVSVAMIGTR